ncbi:MAG: 5-formyltetrahydrofolate cyclo-ligase [Chthoniobacterales bacterium]
MSDNSNDVSTAQEKQNIREEVRNLLRGFSWQERQEASKEILISLQRLPVWQSARRLFLYYPLPTEPDIRPLFADSRPIFLPRTEGQEMIFHLFCKEDLEGEAPKFYEPPSDASSAQPDKEDLLIIPGRAFTSDGRRLGRGGGHYDRYIGNLKELPATVGLCFRCQLRDDLPMEVHDTISGIVVFA